MLSVTLNLTAYVNGRATSGDVYIIISAFYHQRFRDQQEIFQAQYLKLAANLIND